MLCGKEIKLISFLMRREKTLESIRNEGRVMNVWHVLCISVLLPLYMFFFHLFSLSKDHFEFVCCVSF